ncbi:MAG: AI-2E family transporter [Rhodospirillales bacterium]|nr:AI-2E family transporter [Rhodospirillales bacterium]MDE2197403.1 AI-2E family transporter [Rhodospirillales bacterium]MDE2575550.1 AI-2E family transporter [Rhodospirillales bacterium]
MTAERVLMGLLLGGVAVGCVLVLYPFLSALLWAGILTFTTWPVFEWLRGRLRLGRTVAAGAMVVITAIVVVLPLALAAPSGADDVAQIQRAVQDAVAAGLPTAPAWLFNVPAVGPSLGKLWNSWAADLSVMGAAFRPYFGIAAQFGLNLLLGLANGVLLFLLALFAAFFFYASGDQLAVTLRRILVRIAGPRAGRLIEVTGATIRGVVYGILGTAVVQGILTALGLWVCGVPRPALLGVIAGGLSVLPIGAPTVWIPASLWLMASGRVFIGIGLFVYGVVAVSGADTVIRPYFISRGAQLPFLLTMLGVLGGAFAFGLLGIFVGPVLLGVAFALVAEWANDEAPLRH